MAARPERTTSSLPPRACRLESRFSTGVEPRNTGYVVAATTRTGRQRFIVALDDGSGMTVFVVGTDDVASSEPVAAYLAETVASDDVVHVVNSLVGGEDTSSEDVRDGEAAIDVVVDRLVDVPVTVETHQFVRGNEPVEDLLAYARDVDADEFVIGVRKRSPVGKAVFGSTAQTLLIETDRPVRCVPVAD